MPTTAQMDTDHSAQLLRMDSAMRAVRARTRGYYDVQSSRIRTGNRLSANMRAKLGVLKGLTDEELDKQGYKAVEVLDMLKKEYQLVTDGITSWTRVRDIDWVDDGLIWDKIELGLVEDFLMWRKREGQIKRDIGRALDEYSDVWNLFLKHVPGIGPTMAGVLISEIDISKSKYPSSLWAYAGLDVVSTWRLKGYKWKRMVTGEEPPNIELREIRPWVNKEEVNDEKDWEYVVFDQVSYEESNQRDDKGRKFGHVAHCFKTIETEGGVWELHARYQFEGRKGRSSREEHRVRREVKNSDGKVTVFYALSYKPFLKTKMYVLGDSLIRQQTPGEDKYRIIYDNYKARIKQRSDLEGRPDKVFHNMAKKYMVKQFLADYYEVARCLAGLPDHGRYSLTKLKKEHETEYPNDPLRDFWERVDIDPEMRRTVKKYRHDFGERGDDEADPTAHRG